MPPPTKSVEVLKLFYELVRCEHHAVYGFDGQFISLNREHILPRLHRQEIWLPSKIDNVLDFYENKLFKHKSSKKPN